MSFLGKLFGGSGDMMGKVMQLMNSGGDMSKVMPIISEFITDDNIKKVMQEVHKMYAKESEKLEPGHVLHLSLEPDFEQQGLKLVFHDVNMMEADLPKQVINELYLYSITAEQVKAFIHKTFAEQEPEQLPKPTNNDDEQENV